MRREGPREKRLHLWPSGWNQTLGNEDQSFGILVMLLIPWASQGKHEVQHEKCSSGNTILLSFYKFSETDLDLGLIQKHSRETWEIKSGA